MDVMRHFPWWFIVAVIVAIEVYSVHAALDGNSCGYRDSMLDYLACNAFLIALGLVLPLWIALAPLAFLFFGVAVPIALISFIYSYLRNKLK